MPNSAAALTLSHAPSGYLPNLPRARTSFPKTPKTTTTTATGNLEINQACHLRHQRCCRGCRDDAPTCLRHDRRRRKRQGWVCVWEARANDGVLVVNDAGAVRRSQESNGAGLDWPSLSSKGTDTVAQLVCFWHIYIYIFIYYIHINIYIYIFGRGPCPSD